MQAMMVVRYQVIGDAAGFRAGAEKAAGIIATVPGLVWKIWGFGDGRGAGLSAYLFESREAAEAFAAGPVLMGLRRNPEIADVAVEIAPVDRGLSLRTGAEAALGERAVVA